MSRAIGFEMSFNDPMQEIESVKADVFRWLEEKRWKGWDPFDGLSSPFLDWVLEHKRWAMICLQCVKRSPVNLRPLLKIKPQENAMSWAVGLLGALEGRQRAKQPPLAFIERSSQRLIDLADVKTALWGYPFPWAARAFFLKAGEANLVLSSLCLRALAKAIRTMEKETTAHQTGKAHYQKAVTHLYKTFFKPSTGYFSYIAHKDVLVHNANLFGVEALFYANTLGFPFAEEIQNSCRQSLEKTLQAQEPSGRWAYGTASHHQWCDNFHTAYNLIALANIHQTLPHPQIPEAIHRGLTFYLKNAFTKDGRARYYDNQTWPVETHASAAALICLWEMAKGGWLEREKALEQAQRVWRALKRHAYSHGGEFIYREGRFWKVRAVYTRWTQSWIYYGLEALLSLHEN